MWASLPDVRHLPGPESPSFTALVSTTDRPARGAGGCTVGCVCDQDLGPEKGGELPGPPRCGSEAMAAPGRLGSHQVPPQRPVGTRQDCCPLPYNCQGICSLETPQPKPQPVGPLSPNLR